MAKQSGDYRFRGSIDGLCFYKMWEEYYVRRKSCLTGKQFWRNKAFEGSRKSCDRFGKGNTLASKVYQLIEKEKRVNALFCFLRKRAILLLKDGMCVDEAEAVLLDYLVEFGYLKRVEEKLVVDKKKHSGYTIILLRREFDYLGFQWLIFEDGHD
jgi:hypothetical protein